MFLPVGGLLSKWMKATCLLLEQLVIIHEKRSDLALLWLFKCWSSSLFNSAQWSNPNITSWCIDADQPVSGRLNLIENRVMYVSAMLILLLSLNQAPSETLLWDGRDFKCVGACLFYAYQTVLCFEANNACLCKKRKEKETCLTVLQPALVYT